MTRKIYAELESLGRRRLSRHFYMRQFLYSEISNAFGIPNLPEDQELAVKAGEKLCQNCLDPLVDTFGQIEIRSAYRSPRVNDFGNKNGLNCASNARNRAHHIWDQYDKDGNLGATACIFIPWFSGQFDQGRDWKDLAYWLFDHVDFSEIVFFNSNCAFNLNWRENPERKMSSWITGGKGGCPAIVKSGQMPDETEAARKLRYSDFPTFEAPQSSETYL